MRQQHRGIGLPPREKLVLGDRIANELTGHVPYMTAKGTSL
jgi:hypothetical protein